GGANLMRGEQQEDAVAIASRKWELIWRAADGAGFAAGARDRRFSHLRGFVDIADRAVRVREQAAQRLRGLIEPRVNVEPSRRPKRKRCRQPVPRSDFNAVVHVVGGGKRCDGPEYDRRRAESQDRERRETKKRDRGEGEQRRNAGGVIVPVVAQD